RAGKLHGQVLAGEPLGGGVAGPGNAELLELGNGGGEVDGAGWLETDPRFRADGELLARGLGLDERQKVVVGGDWERRGVALTDGQVADAGEGDVGDRADLAVFGRGFAGTNDGFLEDGGGEETAQAQSRCEEQELERAAEHVSSPSG